MSEQVFTLPDLGEGLTEAEVVRWLVADGETVVVDQPVVEVETAKSLVEVPTPYAGTVATRHAPEGSVLEVGKPLLTVSRTESPGEQYREEERAGSGNVLIGYGTAGASAAPTRRRRPRAAAARTPAAATPPAIPVSTTPGTAPSAAAGRRGHAADAALVTPAPPPMSPVTSASTTPRTSRAAGTGMVTAGAAVVERRVPRVVSPLVRRLARDTGVDLRAIAGSGVDGLIVRADVQRALSSAAPDTGVSALDVGIPPAGTDVTTARTGATTADTGVTHAAAGATYAAADTTHAGAVVAYAEAGVTHAGAGVTSAGTGPQRTDTGVSSADTGVTHADTGVTSAGIGPQRADTGVTSAAGERRIPFSGFRKAVSTALTRSRAEIPEATVWVDVDATRLWELREATRPGPGLLAYIARFTVAALREYPVLNSRVDTERQEIVELERIDLGLAVQGNRGLVVPAVTDAGALTTAGLDKEIRRVTQSARQGTVLGSGTFTLNNYGGFRVDGSAAIINHPQVAILGFGRIIDRPWVVDGQICVRKITQMSFVFDHRVCDGGTAAGFMRSVADAIEDPASAIARL